jgi:hypothetical protein
MEHLTRDQLLTMTPEDIAKHYLPEGSALSKRFAKFGDQEKQTGFRFIINEKMWMSF